MILQAMERFLQKKLQISQEIDRLSRQEGDAVEQLVAAFITFEEEPEVKACGAGPLQDSNGDDPLQEIWRGKAFNKIVDITNIAKHPKGKNEMDSTDQED